MLLFFVAEAQNGVRFMTGSFNAVRTIAKEKNKNLLIDTYASWCIPCKRMDKVFERKDVGDFFNDNYLTYRVNMDGPYGDLVKSEYQVVFLPTIIIIGPDGEVKYKVDREMSAEELISIGELALQPGIKIASDATAWRRNGEMEVVQQTYTLPKETAPQKNNVKQTVPEPSKVEEPEVAVIEEVATEPLTEEPSNIVHVLGKGEVPPEILKQEAYFRLQLMDGSHLAAAQRYLATQEDWSTAENMRFILDFANNTDSKEYQHIIANKELYYEHSGNSVVDNTLQILVYRKLYKGIPRPTLAQAIELHKDLDFDNAEELAYKYFMTRHELEESHEKSFETYLDYHNEVASLDIENLEYWVTYISDNKDHYTNNQLLELANLLHEKADDHTGSLVTIKALEARAYILANKCKKARKIIKRTIKKAKKLDEDKSKLEKIVLTCDA